VNLSACPEVGTKENSTLSAWEQTLAKPTASRYAYATELFLIAQTYKAGCRITDGRLRIKQAVLDRISK
jgi:hypothetical protein